MVAKEKSAEQTEIAQHHAAFLALLQQSLAHESGGEVVATCESESGRVFTIHGRIAWVAVSSSQKTFGNHLVDKSLVEDADLREVFDDCRRSGRNFAEAIVEWGILDAQTLRKELLDHVAISLVHLFSWPTMETIFIPTRRRYSGTLTFSLREVLRTAAKPKLTAEPRLRSIVLGLSRWLESADVAAPAAPAAAAPEAAREQQHPALLAEPSVVRCAKRRNGNAEASWLGASDPGALSPANEERSGSIMDVARLREVFEDFKRNAADGLIASDIFTRSDAQSIIGYNTKPAACALFTRVARYLDESLKGSGFPPINRYVVMELVDNKTAVLVNLGPEYLWGILCDTGKLQLGMLLNVILPEAANQFRDLLSGRSSAKVAVINPHLR